MGLMTSLDHLGSTPPSDPSGPSEAHAAGGAGRVRATVAVVAAAALFGTTGTAQELGPHTLDPIAVGAARIVGAGLLLAGLAALRGAYRGVPRPPLGVLVAGAVGVGLYQLGFFTGVRLAGVAIGTVVALASCPVWTGLLSWIVDRRPPGRQWVIATALAVGGVGVLVTANGDGGGGHTLALGVLPALLAGLGYGMYTVAGSKLIAAGQRSDGAMGLLFGAGGMLLLPVLVATWPGGLNSGGGLAVAGYLVIVPTFLAYLLFGAGLRVLPAATVATLNLAEPVVAATLGVTVLAEPITVGGALGALLVLVGLLVLALPARRPRSRS